MSLELTGCLVRFGERDGFDAVVAVVILPCESCIERGDDCGRHYAVLRVVGNPLDTGRDFDLNMEPADAERIGYEFIRVGRLRLAGPPTRVKSAALPLSRPESSSSSSSVWTWRRTPSKCGSGSRASRAWSASCGSRAKGWRHDPERRDKARRRHAGRAQFR